MNWKGHGRKELWPNFTYYQKIWLEGLKKTTQKTSFRVANLRPKPPEYKEGVTENKNGQEKQKN
jgi:hypothetical protein